MGKTSIEWVVNPDGTQGETLNPIRGIQGNWHCTKAGIDCLNCYAERLNIRWGGPPYEPGNDSFRLDKKALLQPLKWRKPRSVFPCDMTDIFHPGIPDEWRALWFGIMSAASHHRYYILTKRPKQALLWFEWTKKKPGSTYDREWQGNHLLSLYMHNAKINYPHPFQLQNIWPLSNVWLGISAGTQELFDKRMKYLVQIPAAHRFISLEPLLEPVDVSPWLGNKVSHIAGFIPGNPSSLERSFKADASGLPDWLLTGCESGPKRRGCETVWIEQILTECKITHTPAFVKQIPVDGRVSRQLDEWPEQLQIREFPHEN